ncbi:patatin-like phospholipase family protein [Flavobacterium sp. N2270]|uniref:patatin-like phospholipase family protein n=1 Tax=Flavobacterium sp. N2270 TaxID=2986831 RepID=UPI002224A78F|nr:patatin-like phospholipase family protein [Flavobacterium sp. N2270]
MKKLILLISLLMISQISFAQDSITTNKKPKIGLVLSGGGAKGLAHIGVLKVIDSLGIKVDYIGGTSMGAIIGGLYASGYSGKDLEYLFNHVDIEALLQDYTPRNSKSFYEKRNDEIYAVTLPFYKFKVGLPSGYSKGLYNFNLLSKLTLHVSDVDDFSKLKIPFFCIATDAETGEEVILDKGILAKALVTSGALPTLYSPIEIDGRLLIDGGVVNNYPVEELKKRGADFIIGVDVQDGLKNRDQLNDVTSLLGQINSYSMAEKMSKKIKQTDIYIKPDIKGYNVISFEKVGELIPKGEIAAKQALSTPALDKNKTTLLKDKIIVSNAIYISGIEINSLENFTRAYVMGKLKIKQNTIVSFEDLEKGVNNLNATQNFSSVFYSFKNVEDGTKLILELKEKKINRFLKFGLHYDDLFKSGALLNITQKKILVKNDVLSLDLILGDNFRYNLNYYIDNGFYWSFGINSRYSTFNKNIPSDFNNGVTLTTLGISSLNVDYSDLSNQLYLQTIFAQKFSIGGGAELKHLRIKSETLLNTNPIFDKSDYFSLFGYLKFDTFNQKYFPKKGAYFNGEIKSFVYSSDYNDDFENFSIVKGDVAVVQTFFKKIAVKLQSEAGFAIGEKSINSFDFALGGYGFASLNNFRPFLGYDFVSLLGDSYIKGSVVADYEIFKKHHIEFTANYANIGTNIFEDDTWVSKPMYSGYGVGYGFETIIGPIEVKHSWSPETGKHFTWFTVGFYF